MAFVTGQRQVQYQPTDIGSRMGMQAASATSQALASLTGAIQNIGSYAVKREMQDLEIKAKEAAKQGKIAGALAQGTGLQAQKAPSEVKTEATWFSPERDTAYSLGFEEGAELQAAKNAQTEITNQAAALTAAWKHDPVKLQEHLGKLKSTITEQFKLKGNESQYLVNQLVDERIGSIMPQVIAAKQAEVITNAKADGLAMYSEALNTASQNIVEGRTTNLEQSFKVSQDILTNMLERGLITDSEYRTSLRAAEDLGAQSVFRNVVEQYVTGTADYDVATNDIKELGNTFRKDKRFSVAEVDKWEASNLQRINQLQTKKDAEIKAANIRQSKANDLANQLKIVNNSEISGVALPKNTANIEAVNNSFAIKMMKAMGIDVPADVTPDDLKTLRAKAEYKEGINKLLGSTEGRAMVLSESKATGLIPTVVTETINAGMFTDNPVLTEKSSELFNQLLAMDSKMVANSLDGESVKYYMVYNQFRETGMDSIEATKIANSRVFNKQDPVRLQLQENIKAGDGKKRYLNNRSEALNDAFKDPNAPWYSSGIKPSATSTGGLRYSQQFNMLYDEAYLANEGNAEQAARYATTILSTKWGRTTINGEDQFMENAPEALYPSLPAEVIKAQWDEDTAQVVKDFELPKGAKDTVITLVPDAQTKVSKDYTVIVQYTDVDGVLRYNMYTDTQGDPLRWKPDVNRTAEAKLLEADAEQSWLAAKMKQPKVIAKEEAERELAKRELEAKIQHYSTPVTPLPIARL